VPVLHGGHPVGSYLLETGMLQRLLEEIEGGNFNDLAYARELRARRRLSGHYFYILAQRVPAHRPLQKVALARLAVETHGDNPLYRSQLGAALDAARDFDAAYAVHSQAIVMANANMFQVHYLMLHPEARGELDRALSIVDRLIAENPDVLWLPLERKRMRRKRRHKSWLGRLGGKLGLDGVLERLLY
jgi:tetratricopeptide (TPR) repeat protein